MASKRRVRRQACEGKVRHATSQAGRAAIAALFRDKGFQGRMNCYRCKFCNFFHIGHRP